LSAHSSVKHDRSFLEVPVRQVAAVASPFEA